MTKTVYSNLYCSVCGSVIGKKPGTEVVLNLLCDSPLCSVQDPSTLTAPRDQLIFFAAMSKIPVTSIAKFSGISRQRVYQIIEQEKRGEAA